MREHPEAVNQHLLRRRFTMSDIVRSIRAELNLGSKIIDCYQFPDGEKRIGIGGASIAIGRSKEYLGRLQKSDSAIFNKLKLMGYTGEIIETDFSLPRGMSRSKTISSSDFDILMMFFVHFHEKKEYKNPESVVRDRLLEKYRGSKEVPTEAGKIDLLTSSEIIEVKQINKWKEALGQILVYGHYYPSHQKRIHLFGECHSSYLEIIQKHCEKVGVLLTWE